MMYKNAEMRLSMSFGMEPRPDSEHTCFDVEHTLYLCDQILSVSCVSV